MTSALIGSSQKCHCMQTFSCVVLMFLTPKTGWNVSQEIFTASVNEGNPIRVVLLMLKLSAFHWVNMHIIFWFMKPILFNKENISNLFKTSFKNI